MPQPSPKLVAIALNIPSEHPLLTELGPLYVYGTLSQLARFSPLQYRDRATLADPVKLDPALEPSDPAALPLLQQICQSTRTQYLLGGTMHLPSSPNNQSPHIKITFCLYDASLSRIAVQEAISLPLADTPPHGLAAVPVAEFNQVINRTVQRILQHLFGSDAANSVVAPFSTSLEAMQAVLRAHRTPDVQDKIALYQAALQADPRLETGYYHLARIYRAEQQYEPSILNYRKVLEISQASLHNRAVYATDAGTACALLGKLEFAKQWWQRAIEYDPDYILPYLNIANTLEDENQLEAAEQYFLRAQQLAPNDFRTFFNLARIYSKMGDWKKALTQYQHQLQTDDDTDPWCHSDVATCYLHLGDTENAKQHLQKTLQLDPDGEAGQYAQLILGGIG